MLEFITTMGYHFRQEISGIHKHAGRKTADGGTMLEYIARMGYHFIRKIGGK